MFLRPDFCHYQYQQIVEGMCFVKYIMPYIHLACEHARFFTEISSIIMLDIEDHPFQNVEDTQHFVGARKTWNKLVLILRILGMHYFKGNSGPELDHRITEYLTEVQQLYGVSDNLTMC